MIHQAYYEIQFGLLHIVYEENVLLSLNVTSKRPEENSRTDFTEKIYHQITDYLAGKRKIFDILYTFQGTEFQKKVWHALEKIPYGEVRTYGEIAKEIGNSKAGRAVGGACHKNPIWLIVPCHRVVGANGSLTGYGGGISMKEKLLLIEGADKKIRRVRNEKI